MGREKVSAFGISGDKGVGDSEGEEVGIGVDVRI